MNILQVGKRLGAFGTIVAVFEASGHWLDGPVATGLIVFFGPMVGGAIFFVIASILDLAVLVWYKRTTTDWFGMEQLRLTEEAKIETLSGKILQKVTHWARPFAYVALCYWDPKYGFIYIQGRRSGSSFTSRDWWWLIVSETIGNLAWIFTVVGAIEVFRHLFL